MVNAATESLRRHGLAGTSFTEVLAESGAARGAIYHHFPGGKTELAEVAVRTFGEGVTAAMGALPDGPDEAAVVEAFLVHVRPVVEQSAAGAGCAVAAVAMEVPAGDRLQVASAEMFAAWQVALAGRLRAAGATPARAGELAALLLSALEGAHVLCRAAGDLVAFDRAAVALRAAAR